jgi:hypothetical protein
MIEGILAQGTNFEMYCKAKIAGVEALTRVYKCTRELISR